MVAISDFIPSTTARREYRGHAESPLLGTPENAITVGTIFLALGTSIWGSQRTCLVYTFSFTCCTVDGAGVYGTTKEALATRHAVPVTRAVLKGRDFFFLLRTALKDSP